MKQSHAEFGNELVKSGNESMIGRLLYSGAERSESGNVEERDDVMQLGRNASNSSVRPLE